MARRRVPVPVVTRTERGFAHADFPCGGYPPLSVQVSSSAEDDGPYLWLGVRKPEVMVLADGWTEVPLPPGASVFGRAHLSTAQVRALIPLLQRFVKTGDLL